MAAFEYRQAQEILGFALNAAEDEEIRRGKDFIQLKNGPFDLDLIFAPDGIEKFDDAWSRRIDIEGFLACLHGRRDRKLARDSASEVIRLPERKTVENFGGS